MESWVSEVNGLSSAILFVYTVTCAVVGRHASSSILTVPTADGETTGHVHFSPRKVLLYSLLVESLVRLHTAVYPHLTTISFSTDTPTLRLPCMMLTFPAINAAVLVGVGKSTSLWSVFAVVGMTLLMLCCAWTVGVSAVQKPAVIMISIVGLSLYLATWILAWVTSTGGLPFGLICFVVAVIGLIITYSIVQLNRTGKEHQELFLTCATLFVYILGQALWAASARTASSAIVSPWIAFIITGVVLISFSLFALARLPERRTESAADGMEEKLVSVAGIGIDEGEENEENGEKERGGGTNA